MAWKKRIDLISSYGVVFKRVFSIPVEIKTFEQIKLFKRISVVYPVLRPHNVK